MNEPNIQNLGSELSDPGGVLNLHGHGGELHEPWSPDWYVDMAVTFSCLAISGFMSGLTIGLASIDELTLEIAAKQSEVVAKRANTIFKVIKQHHWMLVTLLLCNAAALETLPIFLSKAVSELVAIFFAVFGVLVVGEIIPQSWCTGPHKLIIAEYASPIVLGLMYITSPITWPIAKGLDMWLGGHKVTRFNNAQLKEIIHLHSR